ncbi:Multidrug efflux pump subunit AcrB [Desulfurobacterium pacificum]|uniref:Multidrug efflux pump subunit AcrB n=1 Tax=Desulfurobacterium pacificum TaxID=240166 RepID=A0ABY1NL11_9BACT|nr:efflux RND transporter permease subunit [Desulfurobacterium pacificum]SMP12240.1 Multidrug efflux pump subunit AcrB [Desulfurobacterium pacificum]
MNKIVKWYIEKPHAVLAFLLLFSVIGIIGFKEIPRKFFPDANRPTVAVVTVEPGASASDVAAHITRPIEQHLKTLSLVRTVDSVSKDEVSVVTVEFSYKKDIDAAATDVSNELSKIISKLPKDILPPQVYKVTDATKPVMILAVYPRKGSGLTLAQVRELAENEIKDQLLNLPNVSDVEVFGGYEREVEILPDYLKMAKYGITLNQLLKAVRDNNRNFPTGLIINKNGMVVLKIKDEAERIEDLKNILIKPGVYLKDVAKVKWGYAERMSAYHGNGKPAIGISILRSPKGYELPAIESVMHFLPKLEKEYPYLKFEIPFTQEWMIKLSNKNMLESLRDAIIMTLLVIFLFLANIRMLIVSFFSIPITYLITIGLMWLFGFNFNIVTLTAVILALGMLTDDAVVVLENIERHYFELKKDIKTACIDGTQEVMLAVLSGTYTTVVMLLPIVFVGGYVQKILRPLSLTLIIALLVSYVVAMTIIPIVAPYILKKTPDKNFLERKVYDYYVKGFVYRLRDFYVSLVTPLLKLKKPFFRMPFIMMFFMLFVLTMKNVIPILGRDLMPPMDTGIVIVRAEADSNTSLQKTEDILSKMEKILYSMPGIIRVSSTIGSEPGVLSFGSGKTPQQIEMTVQFIDRFHRKETIWQIEDKLRKKFSKIPGLRYVNVMDYGATPLSSIKATIDEMIYGKDPHILDQIGNKLLSLMYKVKGLTSVSRNWYMDKKELILQVDSHKAAQFGLTPLQIAEYIGGFVKGIPASSFVVPMENGLTIKLILPKNKRDAVEKLQNLPIPTKKGFIPLSYFAKVKEERTQSVITHKDLKNTLDVEGYRSTTPTTILQEQVNKLEKKFINLPPGYGISHEGEIKQMNESFKRLMKSLIIGIILLYFSLVPAFSSFAYPISIIAAIPPALIGAAFSMLITHKPQCMPSFMGMILLAGIIVKNSILLIDFIKMAKEKGLETKKAIIESIKIRTRPVLMTAFGTSVGMIPIALGWALGLERLAPLAVVAIGGLLIGTFMTLVFVPVVVSVIEDIKQIGKMLIKGSSKN